MITCHACSQGSRQGDALVPVWWLDQDEGSDDIVRVHQSEVDGNEYVPLDSPLL
jgi:hypothetical protein